MNRPRITGEEWEAFLGVADRLGIRVRDLLGEDVRFSDLEAAAHQFGRAVAQETTERLAGARAQRAAAAYNCPTCGRRCPVTHKDRDLETVDGPIRLDEPCCHCPACDRDFFPSASSDAALATGL
jgi:hypothetical protein